MTNKEAILILSQLNLAVDGTIGGITFNTMSHKPLHRTNCPNCGAILNGQRCSYCGTYEVVFV